MDMVNSNMQGECPSNHRKGYVHSGKRFDDATCQAKSRGLACHPGSSQLVEKADPPGAYPSRQPQLDWMCALVLEKLLPRRHPNPVNPSKAEMHLCRLQLLQTNLQTQPANSGLVANSYWLELLDQTKSELLLA